MKARELERALRERGTPRVLIVGDLLLDRYVSGEVRRISPEAPIPVVTAKGAEERLGGAGNVAANLRAMGAAVDLVAAVGEDGPAETLRRLLADLGVDTGGLCTAADRPTIVKTRVLSGVQQMLRVDWEDPRPLEGADEERCIERVRALAARADALVLSDYGKGVLTPRVLAAAIAAARERGAPVLVDPKGDDYTRYRGATLVTPNRREAEEALGRKLSDLEEVERGAAELCATCGLDAAVVTLGAEGILWRAAAGEGGREPTRARAVFDVTGAGDTVVAHLALHLAAGRDLGVAVALANLAAGVVVGKLGASSVTEQELLAQLGERAPAEGKVLATEAELDAQLALWRAEGRRIVMTNGCFDILHAGHVDYLRFAASKGDVLLVALNDDASVRRLKGEGRPVNTLEDRMAVLAALEMVDAVCSFGEDTPEEIVRRVTPQVLVKGEDWRERGVVGREWVERHGGEVVLAPLVPGRSTTGILERARGTPPRERG